MKPLTPSLINQGIGPDSRIDFKCHFFEKLPVGLTVICLKESADQMDITLPAFGEKDLVMTFISYKGDLRIAIDNGQDYLQQVSPGLGLLSAGDKPLQFRSFSPVSFSAVILVIARDWTLNFMKDNDNFKKIEQALEEDSTVITCRLGRRQLSLFSSIIAHRETGQNKIYHARQFTTELHPADRQILNTDNARGNLLEIQNHTLSLLEYFLCNRYRSPLGANPSGAIDNEDDLSLVKEVESYISEYYCSDTFTVDSILKKTYTSYHKLNFLFKSIHGMTISEYIRNKRIEKSKEMIADNAKSISQIAYEIGYSSISNYILAFKKIYQITPGKYKKQIEA